jgi:hypothetical protein
LGGVADGDAGLQIGVRRGSCGGVDLVDKGGLIVFANNEEFEDEIGVEVGDGEATVGVCLGTFSAIDPAGGAIDTEAFSDVGFIDEYGSVVDGFSGGIEDSACRGGAFGRAGVEGA